MPGVVDRSRSICADAALLPAATCLCSLSSERCGQSDQGIHPGHHVRSKAGMRLHDRGPWLALSSMVRSLPHPSISSLDVCMYMPTIHAAQIPGALNPSCASGSSGISNGFFLRSPNLLRFPRLLCACLFGLWCFCNGFLLVCSFPFCGPPSKNMEVVCLRPVRDS